MVVCHSISAMSNCDDRRIGGPDICTVSIHRTKSCLGRSNFSKLCSCGGSGSRQVKLSESEKAASLPAKLVNFCNSGCEKAQILQIYCATNADIAVFVFDYDMAILARFTSFIEFPKELDLEVYICPTGSGFARDNCRVLWLKHCVKHINSRSVSPCTRKGF